jgi:hypothetical protein
MQTSVKMTCLIKMQMQCQEITPGNQSCKTRMCGISRWLVQNRFRPSIQTCQKSIVKTLNTSQKGLLRNWDYHTTCFKSANNGYVFIFLWTRLKTCELAAKITNVHRKKMTLLRSKCLSQALDHQPYPHWADFTPNMAYFSIGLLARPSVRTCRAFCLV